MSHWLLAFGVAFAAMAIHPASAAAPDDAKADAPADLDGVWRGFVVEGKGEQPDHGSVQLELTIKDKHITAQRLDGEGGSLGEGSYRIKTGKSTWLDATELRKTGKRRTFLGILKTETDEIRWCVATPGNRRPTTYETIDQRQFFLILKRQK